MSLFYQFGFDFDVYFSIFCVFTFIYYILHSILSTSRHHERVFERKSSFREELFRLVGTCDSLHFGSYEEPYKYYFVVFRWPLFQLYIFRSYRRIFLVGEGGGGGGGAILEKSL